MRVCDPSAYTHKATLCVQVMRASIDARESEARAALLQVEATGDKAAQAKATGELAAAIHDGSSLALVQALAEGDTELVKGIARSESNLIHTCDSDMSTAFSSRVSCTSSPS